MATSRVASSSQKKQSNLFHQAVMAEESVHYLLTDPSGVYVDCTLGAGGHSRALLQAMNAEGRLIGIDRDEKAIAHFQPGSKQQASQVALFHTPFSLLQELLRDQQIRAVDGVLFDLGVASFQIDDPQRGFSYLQDGPLDMRMDTKQSRTAAEIVNTYSEQALAEVIRNYGQERRWRAIARAVVRARQTGAITRTGQLAHVIRSVIPRQGAIKTLSRTFQSLRIEINQELKELHQGLESAVDLLKPGGRLVVICYQSLEDRVVKEIFARLSGKCQCPPELPRCVCGARQVIRILTRKAIRPSAQEIQKNPRARSARLRAAEKLP